MGKSLKGKELGTGISQRKDGLYTARYTNRQEKENRNILKIAGVQTMAGRSTV